MYYFVQLLFKIKTKIKINCKMQYRNKNLQKSLSYFEVFNYLIKVMTSLLSNNDKHFCVEV